MADKTPINTTKKKCSKHNDKPAQKPLKIKERTFFKPYHFLFLLIGVTLFLIGFYLFIFEHKPDKILFLIPNKKRFIYALITSTVASAFLILGAASIKFLGTLLAAILSLILCYLPWHYKDAYRVQRDQIIFDQHIEKIKDDHSPEDIEKLRIAQQQGGFVSELDFFKSTIHYSEIQQLNAQEPDLQTLTLVIDQFEKSAEADIRSFYNNTLGEKVKIHTRLTKFPIKNAPALTLTIQYSEENESKVRESLKAFINPIHKTELADVLYITFHPITNSSIEKEVNNQNTNTHNHFLSYARVLNSFSQDEVIRSLRFFRQQKNVIYAHDMMIVFRKLLKTRNLEFKVEVVKTQQHWMEIIKNNNLTTTQINEYHQSFLTELSNELNRQIENHNIIPDFFYNYCAEKQLEGSESILYHKWKNSIKLNEQFMIKAAPLSEKALLDKLHLLNSEEWQSAHKILTTIGTTETINKLQKMLQNEKSEENKKRLRSSIDSIKNKL